MACYERSLRHVERGAGKRIMENDSEIYRLNKTLEEIGRLAMNCWMDMQGRLVDDTHRKAHGVLQRIVEMAATSIKDPATAGANGGASKFIAALEEIAEERLHVGTPDRWRGLAIERRHIALRALDRE